MSLPENTTIQELFDPTSSAGDEPVQIGLTLREASALSLTIELAMKIDAELEYAAHLFEGNEAQTKGYLLALYGAVLKLQAGQTKAISWGEGKLEVARVGAKLDQHIAGWKEAA